MGFPPPTMGSVWRRGRLEAPRRCIVRNRNGYGEGQWVRPRLAPISRLTRSETQETVVPCGMVKTRRGKAKRIGDTGQENTATALLPFKLTPAFRLALRRPLSRCLSLITLLRPCLRRIRELVFEAAAFPLIGAPAAPFAALRPV